jgi:predicted transcriptional regulator
MDPVLVRLPQDLQARVDKIASQLDVTRAVVLRLAIARWVEASEKEGLNPLLGKTHGTRRETPAGKAG